MIVICLTGIDSISSLTFFTVRQPSVLQFRLDRFLAPIAFFSYALSHEICEFCVLSGELMLKALALEATDSFFDNRTEFSAFSKKKEFFQTIRLDAADMVFQGFLTCLFSSSTSFAFFSIWNWNILTV